MFFIYLMTIEDEEERKLIEDLYYKYRYHCLHMAKKYTEFEDEAEDMVQETFVRVIRHKDEYLKLEVEAFEALLTTIVKHLGIDAYRERKRVAAATARHEEMILSRGLPTETKFILQEELRIVLEELHKYDDDTQLIMYYKSLNVPTKDIAEIMGMSYKTVETRIYRVRKKLKELVKEGDLRMCEGMVDAEKATKKASQYVNN